jgi:hypothetical protein
LNRNRGAEIIIEGPDERSRSGPLKNGVSIAPGRSLAPAKTQERRAPICRRLDLAGIFVFATCLLVYVITLAPGVLPSDPGEFQAKLYSFGLIHQPGYPLYSVAGWLWVRLCPFGSVAYRVNLFSAVCAASAAWVLYGTMREIVKERVPALVAAFLLAFSPWFWDQAITAGTYPLNALLFASLLRLSLSVFDGQSHPLCVPIVMGLGLAHHRLIIVSYPAVLAAVLLARKRMLPTKGIRLLWPLALALPLGLYCILICQGAWPLPKLLGHVLISGGAVHKVQGTQKVFGRLVDTVWPWISAEFGLPLTLAGMVGMVALSQRSVSLSSVVNSGRRRFLALLLASLLVSHLAFYSLVFIEPDEPRYIIPALMLIAMGVGLVVSRIVAVLRRLSRSVHILGLLALFLPGLSLYRNFSPMVHRYDNFFEDLSYDALATAEEDSVIVASWTYVMPLRYFQTVEGLRPDLRLLMPNHDVGRDQVVRWIESGRPVYFREGTFGLDWRSSGLVWIDMNIGGLYRALPSEPVFEHWVRVDSDPVAVSVGFSEWPLQQDALTAVRTLWRAESVPSDATRVALELTDDDEQVWGQWSAPIGLENPESQNSQVTVADVYFVTPPAIPPSRYSLEIRLAGQLADVTTFSVRGIPVAARPLREPLKRLVASDILEVYPDSLHSVQLVAADWPGRRFSENTIATLRLFWQLVDSSHPPNLSLYLSSSERDWALFDEQPLFQGMSGSDIPTGTLLESRHTMEFSEIPPGRYRATAKLRSSSGVSVHRAGGIRVDARKRLYVEPAIADRSGSVIAGQIELLGFDFNPPPGERCQDITVTLYWRPSSTIEDDYKVFVHVMSSSGELVAQRDSLPLGGTVLTSHWSPMEIITDPYCLSLPAGLAEGSYRIEVGMYKPDTGERLSAVDAEGNRWLDDKVILESFEVQGGIQDGNRS